ncbi:hypothetical protein HDU98_009890 [Podochytrium sp. JEL0797]|nr:hypothetical protein HDU98_009890 [Podochytrium sp. JEL0797]
MKPLIVGIMSVSAAGIPTTATKPATLLSAVINSLPACAMNCVGELGVASDPAIAAVCGYFAGYSVNFTSCINSPVGCSAAGSTAVSQANALIPALNSACSALPTATSSGYSTIKSTYQSATPSPAISNLVYSNQTSQRTTLSYFSQYSDPTVLQNANLANMDVLIYNFVNLTADGGCSFGNGSMENLSFALSQRDIYPNLRVVLSVGANATVFTTVTSNTLTLAAFAQNCVDLVIQANADGLDLDWEVPKAGDASNLLAAIQLLRATLGPNKSLSMVAATDIYSIMNANLPALSPYLDWYGVMSYLYRHVRLQGTSTQPSIGVDSIVKTFLSTGIPPNQIAIGIAFYGFACQVPPNGDTTQLENCVVQSDNSVSGQGGNGTTFFNNVTLATYTYEANGTVLVYNTPQSAQLKAQYAINSALYGVMMWELSQDVTFGIIMGGSCNGTVLNPRCGGAAFGHSNKPPAETSPTVMTAIELTPRQQKEVFAAACSIDVRSRFPPGIEYSFTLCVFGDSRYLEPARTGSTVHPDAIMIGLSADPADLPRNVCNMVLGDGSWSSPTWNCAAWIPQQWSLYLFCILRAIPVIQQRPPDFVILSHRLARGRPNFTDEIVSDFKRITPPLYHSVDFPEDLDKDRDLAVLFDLQVSKELAAFGLVLPDRTVSPAMLFNNFGGEQLLRIVDADRKVFRTITEYISSRIDSGTIRRADVLDTQGELEFRQAAKEISEELLKCMQAPNQSEYCGYDSLPAHWKADADEKIQKVIEYLYARKQKMYRAI